MTDLLIWCGPVQVSDLKSVIWSNPTQILTVSHGPGGGYGSSSFSALAASLKGPDGRILDNLLAQSHLSRGQFTQIACSGFSAAHGLLSPLLFADGDLLSACVCMDACFSDPARLAKQGYISFGALAAQNQKLFLMSSSSGGGVGSGATISPSTPDYSTGSQCMLASGQGAAVQSSTSLSSYAVPPDLPNAQNAVGYQDGNMILLDYGSQTFPTRHGWHVWTLGPILLQKYLVPYLAGDSASLPPGISLPGQSSLSSLLDSPSSSSLLGPALLFGGITLAGAYALHRKTPLFKHSPRPKKHTDLP